MRRGTNLWKKKASIKALEGDKALGTYGSKVKKRESAGKGKVRERDSSSTTPRDTKPGLMNPTMTLNQCL
jgi:hypothetical protein